MRSIYPEEQHDPLLPGYSFNRYLVAGKTPIFENGPLDFVIDRPFGMSGYILNMTVEGQGKVFEGEDEFYCNEGDLLLFPPDYAHYYRRSPHSLSWQHRWVYFRPRAYWANWLKWKKTSNGIGQLSLSLNMENKKHIIQEFDQLLNQIDQTYKAGRSTSEDLAINLLERLLIRCFEESSDFLTKKIDPRIQDVCQYLTENLAQERSLEQIARHICLSPSRLAHLFRKETGVNLMRWREDQRISLAKQLLQNPAISIAKIANEVGYEDQFYFSRVFLKRVGISPSLFRKDLAVP
ncbi:ara regulon transcriptional activator [Gammaproteobacteria bacterium]|nr:ara regulon transcriptional activator [Gammaproteobacteria bacterium]